MDRLLSKHHSKFTWLMDWIYVLVIINLLAIAGTVIGLGVFGFFPAWMTSHQLIKRRLNQEDFPLVKTFISTYKTYVIKANILGYIMVILGIIIALSWFYYLDDLQTTWHWVGLIGVGFLGIILIFMIGIVPISYVYFPKFSIGEHLRFTLLMTMGMPMLAITIFLNSLFFYGVVMVRFITIFPFLSFTLPVLVNLLFARKKLLKLFTVFKDEHIAIRTLNSFSNMESIDGLLESEGMFEVISHDEFLLAVQNPFKIQSRASLVLTNAKEDALGVLLTHLEEKKVVIDFLIIDPQYRKRGYGKKMLTWLEKQAIAGDFESIQLGHTSSLIQAIPVAMNPSLAWFRRQGYEILTNEHGYFVKKALGGIMS